MGVEIERKFLVRGTAWRRDAGHGERLVQGYLANNERCSVRVRLAERAAWLNVKEAVAGARRAEFEYPVPVEDARAMLETLCGPSPVEKTRYRMRAGTHVWEIDEFHGANAGLVVAEIELARPDEDFARPEWLGEEVTGDLRYYNNRLAEAPFTSWPRSGTGGSP